MDQDCSPESIRLVVVVTKVVYDLLGLIRDRLHISLGLLNLFEIELTLGLHERDLADLEVQLFFVSGQLLEFSTTVDGLLVVFDGGDPNGFTLVAEAHLLVDKVKEFETFGTFLGLVQIVEAGEDLREEEDAVAVRSLLFDERESKKVLLVDRCDVLCLANLVTRLHYSQTHHRLKSPVLLLVVAVHYGIFAGHSKHARRLLFEFRGLLVLWLRHLLVATATCINIF